MSASATCRLSALAESRPTVLRTDDRDIVLVRQGSQVYALDDICTHAEVSLSEGDVAHDSIECWLHGSRFDLRTGQPSGPPATQPVATYATTLTVDQDGEPVVVVHLNP